MQDVLLEPEGRWCFDRFTLDTATGTLQADAQQVVLRPKTAMVLAILLGRGGEVVPREALLDAAWPHVTVTDDSLTQCISEIRRALGPRGPELLRTLPRRGYLIAVRAEWQQSPPTPPAREAMEAPEIAAAPPPPRASRPPIGLIGALAAATILVLAGLWLLARSPAMPEGPRVNPVQAEAAALLEAGTQPMYGADAFADPMPRSVALLDRALAVAAARASFAHAKLLLTENSEDPARDLAEADRYAALAEAASPGLPIAMQARAGVLRLRGRLAEASVLFDSVAEQPGETSARAVAAHLRVLLGRPGEAIPMLRALLVQSPNHPYVGTWQLHLGQAQLLAGEGDFGAAAFDLPPSRPGYMRADERLCHRAAALWQTGQREQARMILTDLTARRPELSLEWLRARRRSSEPGFVEMFEARLMVPLAEAGLRP